jgi:hypothetical protein
MSDHDDTTTPRPTGRRSDPNPIGPVPTWDCHRAAEHVSQCPGCRLALDALIHERVGAILSALGTDTTTNH